jgi:hypothetical protein
MRRIILEKYNMNDRVLMDVKEAEKTWLKNLH